MRFLTQFSQSPDGKLWGGELPASFKPYASKLATNVKSAVVASAAALDTDDYAIIAVSGTAEITTIRMPSGFRGLVMLIPAAACTGATGGTWSDDGTDQVVPIAKAFTAVANRALLLVCDGLLCYPCA